MKNSDFSCEHCLSVLSVVDSSVVEDSTLHNDIPLLRVHSHTKGAFGGVSRWPPVFHL